MSDLRPDQLTEKEIEVIRLVADGLTSKEIGERMHLSLSSIRWHYLYRLYRKLGYRPYAVKCRMELVRWAIRNGIIAAGLLLCVSVAARAQTLDYYCPPGQAGISWECIPTVTGMTPPYNFTVPTGTLPPWMNLDAATGTLGALNPPSDFALVETPGSPNITIIIASKGDSHENQTTKVHLRHHPQHHHAAVVAASARADRT